LELLEGRVLLAADVYTWNPQAGSTAANLSQNWELNGVQQGVGANLPGKNSTDIVAFNGSVSNAPIEWNQNFKFSTMSLGLTGGRGAAYTGLQTLDTAVTVELSDADGNWCLNSSTDSKLNLYFGTGTTAVFQIDGDATINNMALSGYPGNKFVINGGTTTIAQSGGYTDTIGVNFVINQNGTLNDQSYNSLKFTNSGVQITVQGSMFLYYGTGTGITLIDNGGMSNDYINVNGGTLKYSGSGNVTQDTLTVPVYVQNGGTFRLSAATGQPNGGKLTVQDGSQYQFPNNSLESVYMTGASSTVQLAYGDTLECDNDYWQAGGTLETTDATTCTLQDGAQGTGIAVVAGGTVWIDTIANSYGELDVKAATLNFGGQLNVSVQGYTPSPGQFGMSDKLKVVNGVFNLDPQGSTSLYVNDYGTVVGGDNWIVIYASNITSSTDTIDFKTKTSNPQQNFNYWPNKPQQGQYEITI
jgi:hypothetical protein